MLEEEVDDMSGAECGVSDVGAVDGPPEDTSGFPLEYDADAVAGADASGGFDAAL